MAFRLARCTRIMMLMVPVWPVVSQLTASIQLSCRPAVSAGRYYGPGNDRGVGAVGLGADRNINALRWLEYVMCGLA